jgi:hypothetical protein
MCEPNNVCRPNFSSLNVWWQQQQTIRRGLIYGTFENSSIALDSFFLRLPKKKNIIVVVEEIHRFPIASEKSRGKSI